MSAQFFYFYFYYFFMDLNGKKNGQQGVWYVR